MAPNKKRKKSNRLSPKRTLSREKRLQSAKEWLPKYEGKYHVRAYAQRYHTDLLCAITELRMLGIVITEEYETTVKRSIADSIAQKQKRKEVALLKEDGLVWGVDQDESFAFIVVYTSGGFPYGLSWDELTDDERQMFSKD